MRVREGRIPWLARHLQRLHASITALGGAEPPDDLVDLVQSAAGSNDSVVRLELSDGQASIGTREVNAENHIGIVVATEPHLPYPHKTTRREQFGRAFSEARRRGAEDALLVTAHGYVAEGTTWNLFWWDDGTLCTPAAELGILPGLGRKRILELSSVREERASVKVLAGRSLFLVNAVRGIVEISRFEGAAVPPDLRTAELSSTFWPD